MKMAVGVVLMVTRNGMAARNPIGPTELNKSQTDGYNFLANLTAELTFTKWLKFKKYFRLRCQILVHEQLYPQV